MLGIKDIAYVFGGVKVSNIEYAEKHGFDVKFLSDKVGIETRYEATEEQASSDLAIAATDNLLKSNAIDASEIEIVIVVTQTPDYQLPHTAAIVQERLGLNKDIPTFDISLGCSGYVYGLNIITSFMHANNLQHGVLITVDTYTKIIDPDDRATAPLFSDAAAATLITNEPVYTLLKGTYNTDGTGKNSLIVESGGSRDPSKNSKLFMDGRAIYNFMMQKIPIDIERCIEANNLEISEIDKFVFHQANKFMLESLSKRMSLENKKIVYNVKDSGNTVSATIPIALSTILNDNNNLILISGFGVGLSWATNILKLV